MPLFRYKAVVEAMQFTGGRSPDVCRFGTFGRYTVACYWADAAREMLTLDDGSADGPDAVTVGSWLVKEDGRLSVYPAAKFAARFEPARPEDTQ